MAIILILCIAVFLSAVASDVVEARMVAAMVNKDPHGTARLSVLMWAIGCVSWIIVAKTDNWYIYLAPEVAGLYIGSWIGVSRGKRKRRKRSRNTCRKPVNVQESHPVLH